jgi:hypothetical protein
MKLISTDEQQSALSVSIRPMSRVGQVNVDRPQPIRSHVRRSPFSVLRASVVDFE